MTNANTPQNPVAGLRPLIDPRIVPNSSPFVVYGKNFMPAFRGIKTEFGGSLLSIVPLSNLDYCEVIEIEEESYIFTTTGVYTFNETAKIFVSVFEFAATYDAVWPWSMGFIGNKYYFVKSGMSTLVIYNPVTGEWKESTPTGLPSNPVGLCKSYARLWCVGATTTAWSAIDDGEDFAPSNTTGAGFQANSLVGGTAFAVKPTTEGALTYTSRGIIRHLSTGTTVPFAARPIADARPAINPFAIVQLDETSHLYLAATGFFRVRNETAEKFMPLFTEYFADVVLPSTDITNYQAVKIHYDENRGWVFMSISNNPITSTYERAFVYDIAREELGSFDEEHYTIGNVGYGRRVGSYDTGFIGLDGWVYYFDGQFFLQTPPSDASALLWTSLDLVMTPQVRDGFTIGVAIARLSAVAPSIYEQLATGYYSTVSATLLEMSPVYDAAAEIPTFSDVTYLDYEVELGAEDYELVTGGLDYDGFYDTITGFSNAKFGAGVTQVTLELNANEEILLNSCAVIGPLRLTQQQWPDETSQLTDLLLGSPDATPGVAQDYELLTGTEDYETTTGAVDYDGNVTQTFTFTVTHYPTYSGKWTDPAAEITPALVRREGATAYYDFPPNNGIWHYIGVATTNPQDGFAINALEQSGFLTGRLGT